MIFLGIALLQTGAGVPFIPWPLTTSGFTLGISPPMKAVWGAINPPAVPDWISCTLSHNTVAESGTRTATGIPWSDNKLVVAIHYPTRKHLLRKYVELEYKGRKVKARVIDTFVRYDLKHRIDCSTRVIYALTGTRGGLHRGAKFREVKSSSR